MERAAGKTRFLGQIRIVTIGFGKQTLLAPPLGELARR